MEFCPLSQEAHFMDAVQFDTGLAFDELHQESVELLPARKTLSCGHGGSDSFDLDLGLVVGLGLGISSNN